MISSILPSIHPFDHSILSTSPIHSPTPQHDHSTSSTPPPTHPLDFPYSPSPPSTNHTSPISPTPFLITAFIFPIITFMSSICFALTITHPIHSSPLFRRFLCIITLPKPYNLLTQISCLLLSINTLIHNHHRCVANILCVTTQTHSHLHFLHSLPQFLHIDLTSIYLLHSLPAHSSTTLQSSLTTYHSPLQFVDLGF